MAIAMALMTSIRRLYFCIAAEGTDKIDEEDDDLRKRYERHADVETHQTSDATEQGLDLRGRRRKINTEN